MARTPKGYDIDYFPHEVVSGKKRFIVENKYGNNGYAVWFKMLELLCTSHLQCYDLEPSEEKQYAVTYCDIDESLFDDIISYFSYIGIFDKELFEMGLIFSEKLVLSVKDVYRKRSLEIPQKEEIVQHYRDFRVKNPCTSVVSSEFIPQSKVKESKVKESKERTVGFSEKNLAQEIFNFWNSKNIIVHKSMNLKNGNEKYENIIKRLSKDYDEDEIKQTILNYSVIIKNEDGKYRDVYKWTLPEFLARGFEKYINWEMAHKNALIFKNKQDNELNEGDQNEIFEYISQTT